MTCSFNIGFHANINLFCDFRFCDFRFYISPDVSYLCKKIYHTTMTFKEQITLGIADILPSLQPYDTSANHAPVRKDSLTP